MNNHLTNIIQEIDNLPCCHPTSIGQDVANLYYSFTKMVRPLLIVEIGCFIGFSTLHFAKALRELGFGKIISIDAFDESVDAGKGMQNRQEVAEYYCQKAGLQDLVTYVKGYSTQVYPQLLSQINQRIDLLYIDGDHSVTGAFADFNTYYNDLRVGGHIILHDIYPPMCGVDGPRVLVDHLRAYKTIPRYLELIEMSTLDGFGVAIMRKTSPQPLHILLPESQRWKRIINKLKGQVPFFSGQIPPLIRLRLGITVIDRHNRQPIVGAKLICPQRFGEYRLTGKDGTVWLDHYLANRYLFEAVAEGYISKTSILIDVKPNQPVQKFTIELEPLPKGIKAEST